MSTTRLNPLDTAWIFTESRATPNHVGGLLQFRLPDDAPFVIFAAGRMAGWLAHAMEQRETGRLIRPRARYTGL